MTFDEFTQKLISEIAKELRTKQTCLEFDDVPTANSANPVTSDGIKTYIDNATINDIRVAEGEFDDTTKKIILTLTNGTVIDFSVADLVSGLQSEISSSNKLSADFIDDTSSTNKLTNATEKTAWNNKLDKVTTTTEVMQAYVKQVDGTQIMVYVHWNNIRDTIPIRDQTGNIRVSLVPTTSTHATSKQYVDSLIPHLYEHIYKLSGSSTTISSDYFLAYIKILSPNDTEKSLSDIVTSYHITPVSVYDVTNNVAINGVGLTITGAPYPSGYNVAVRYLQSNGSETSFMTGHDTISLTKISITQIF